jgi:hypothetical protein
LHADEADYVCVDVVNEKIGRIKASHLKSYAWVKRLYLGDYLELPHLRKI